MNRRYFGVAIMAFLLVSCSEIREKLVEKETKQIQPFLFNLEHYFSEEEFNVSFPIWFNDSVIVQNKIQTLTRTVYMSSSEKDTTDASPKEVKTYTFSEEGYVNTIQVEQYYDNVMVGSMTFSISEPDEYGFATALSREGSNSKADEEILDPYRFYAKEKYADKFLVYDDLNTGDYLFYMLNEKNWGTLSVDSIFNPTAEDLIVFGRPRTPKRMYQVENRVNEFNVVDFSYGNGFEYLEQISFEKYPFHYKRSVLYNDDGLCTGFVDSTFSNQKYLTRRESMFHFIEELPVRLIHENRSGKSSASYYQFETFSYAFFE